MPLDMYEAFWRYADSDIRARNRAAKRRGKRR